MQVLDNPSNSDIRDVLIQFRDEFILFRDDVNPKFEQLDDRFEQLENKFEGIANKVDRLENQVEKLDYKFDVYQKGTDGMVQMATTIIIATASVVVLANLSPAVNALNYVLFLRPPAALRRYRAGANPLCNHSVTRI
ncbi:MAG: hypothetical protein SNJ57_06740 [Cyanobacteriota bacterium]